MLTAISPPPAASEKKYDSPRRAYWNRNSLILLLPNVHVSWKTPVASRYVCCDVREKAFCPKVWFWPLTSIPVTVLGLTLPRRVMRLLLLRLWSMRREYRLVPSKTGKFPFCEDRVANDEGNPLQVVLNGLHEVKNCESGLLPLLGVGSTPSATSPANCAGYAPFTAIPDAVPAATAYCCCSGSMARFGCRNAA